MKKFLKLFPDERAKSAYAIDYPRLYRNGIRGLIFDIDNTLVPHNAPPDAQSRALMKTLQERGFQLITVSNNHEPRVKSLADRLQIDYIFDAHKPSKKGYLAACRKMGLRTAETACIGDQIFTDVLGANRAGIHSILVEPVDRKTDIPRIRLKRLLERPILWLYGQRKTCS